MPTRNVLITGATGFIGSHLTARIAAGGDTVNILALPGDKKALEYEAAGYRIFYGDITDPEILDRALKEIQVVYHLAAVVSDWAPAELYRKVNVEGTENICRASLANRVERFIHMSTNDVFGRPEGKVIDESCPYLPWHEPYPDSKLKASNIVWEYHSRGLPVSMIYPCWVYGPGDTTFLLPLIEAISKKQLVFWRKNALIWPAYIDNVVDLLLTVSSHPGASGQGFIVHDGVFDTFQNFVTQISKTLNLECLGYRIPYAMAYGIASVMQNLRRVMGSNSRPLLTTYIVKNLGSRWKFSISKARNLLGWEPPVSYNSGLKTTLKWAGDMILARTKS